MSPFDTEDNFSCTVTFPTGIASAQLTWNAGFRKVIYTIHGDDGAIKVEDDDIEIASRSRKRAPASAPTAGKDARKVADGDAAGAKWSFDRKEIASDWMDSSHVTWFNSLFDDFKGAIERRDFVGKEARDASLCVQLIRPRTRRRARGAASCRSAVRARSRGTTSAT